jgi:Holliday junction resolvase RusA-like endonuclease
MTRRGKYQPRALKYLAWKEAIAMLFVDQAKGFRFDKKARLLVSCVFYISSRVTIKDTDNLLKTINDTLQHSGIIPNDNQIYVVIGIKIPAPLDYTDIQIIDIGELVEKA